MARILIVEDDGALRNDIADRLAEWGHEVHQASDGKRGFLAIQKHRPDLVLSDISMPSGSGFELVNRVRGCGLDYANMPFLFLSASSERKSVVFGMHSGADDYIVKPIDYRTLKKTIDEHLKRKAGWQGTLTKWFVRSRPNAA